MLGEDPLELVTVGNRRREVGDDETQLFVVLQAGLDVDEARVVDEVDPTDGRTEELERAPFGRMPTDEHRLAVGDVDHPIVTGPEAADPARIVVAVPQGVVQVLVDVEHRLGHRHVDPLADACAVSLVERGDDRRRRLESGVHVTMAVGILGQLSVRARRALRCDDAGLGLDDRRIRPATGPRSGLPVARDRCDDQPRVGCAQLFGIETEPSHHAGAEILDDDVDLVRQRANDLGPARRRKVDAHVALAGVLLHEVRR